MWLCDGCGLPGEVFQCDCLKILCESCSVKHVCEEE